MSQGFWNEFWAAIKHWSILVWAIIGFLSTFLGWSILGIVSSARAKRKTKEKSTGGKISKKRASRMMILREWYSKNARRLLVAAAIGSLLFVLGAASYTVQNNLRNNLAQTIKDDNATMSDLQNKLIECIGSHRPTVRPADSLPVSTVQNTQTQQVQVQAPLFFINSGDRPAYQLRIRVAHTLEQPTADLVVEQETTLTNPVYPGQQITTSTIVIPIPAPVEGQVVWVYLAVRYFDTANADHCYEDEFWFAYPVGATAFASMPQDMKDAFEPNIRQVYGTTPQCQ